VVKGSVVTKTLDVETEAKTEAAGFKTEANAKAVASETEAKAEAVYRDRGRGTRQLLFRLSQSLPLVRLVCKLCKPL